MSDHLHPIFAKALEDAARVLTDHAAPRPKDTDPTVKQIRSIVRMVSADRDSFGVLSTGEKCAVALVLDDPELMKWWGTALECVHRLEGEWIAAAIYVQRNGWN